MGSQNPLPPVTDPIGARSAAALRELHERAQAAIAARREHASRLESDITGQIEAIASVLAGQQTLESADAERADEAQAEIKRLTAELEESDAASKLERAAWESERAALEKQRIGADEERGAFQAERLEWDTERSTFESERVAWQAERSALEADEESRTAERSAWESERNQLIAKVATLEAEQRSSEVQQQTSQEELRASQDESCRHLADLEKKLLSERTNWERERTEWAAERAALQRQGDELRQKFELALEDVQRFRSRVAELEQELARRPAAGSADSAELIALRAERDSLAQRIEEIEREPAVRVDADTEQQRADLQRRFELAVEDIRELKTRNAKLEGQLAGAKKHSGAAADASGGMDWESQKRRLLASLDGGDADDDAACEEERAKIESAIEITDAVVAEKDQMIAELKAQLAERDDLGAEEAQREAAINQLVNADETVAQHRKNIAQLEQEMENKLRAAELEVSIERAKIARNRAELEDLRIELESQRKSLGTSAAPTAIGAPKRRWLSKLGLTGEEEP